MKSLRIAWCISCRNFVLNLLEILFATYSGSFDVFLLNDYWLIYDHMTYIVHFKPHTLCYLKQCCSLNIFNLCWILFYGFLTLVALVHGGFSLLVELLVKVWYRRFHECRQLSEFLLLPGCYDQLLSSQVISQFDNLLCESFRKSTSVFFVGFDADASHV